MEFRTKRVGSQQFVADAPCEIPLNAGRSVVESPDSGLQMNEIPLRKEFHKELHFNSELKLKYPRQIQLRRRFTEGGVTNVQVIATETDIVKDVEPVGSKHKSQILADLKIP